MKVPLLHACKLRTATLSFVAFGTTGKLSLLFLPCEDGLGSGELGLA